MAWRKCITRRWLSTDRSAAPHLICWRDTFCIRQQHYFMHCESEMAISESKRGEHQKLRHMKTLRKWAGQMCFRVVIDSISMVTSIRIRMFNNWQPLWWHLIGQWNRQLVNGHFSRYNVTLLVISLTLLRARFFLLRHYKVAVMAFK